MHGQPNIKNLTGVITQHWGKNVGWGCFRIGCWGEYLGSERNEVRGEWSKTTYWRAYWSVLSQNIIWAIKLRRMRWGGNILHMGDRRGAYRFLVGKLEEKRPLGRPRRGRKNIIRWIFRKWQGGAWAWLIWFWIGTSGRTLVNTVLNFWFP